ncbi:hypothetical protein VTK73DRAFT_1568 [Phialemonium thermophilum]|uniref:Uncharacterized protein n=1 Tax=Phialemonium thermophilum TaxID=223376 RepID=A0ABR3VT79_9PEZI
MCASVLLTPPIAWLQHTTHLVRPLFSCDLDLDLDLDLEEAPRDASGQQQPRRRRRRQASPSSWTPSADVQKGWPRRYAADEANLIFVAPDWSDLEATVRWLERNPQVAEGIARRQRDLFVGGGYFSPAAEACYWRALIRGWSRVARTEGEGWEEKEGVRWELFSMGHDP